MKNITKAKKNHLKPKKKTILKASKSKAVKVSPRSHLAVHKRFILHPMTVMVVLVVGVLMIGITFKTVAQTISATIEAPNLITGAVILSPVGGSSLYTQTVNVTGSCPNNSYVKIYVNSSFGGVAWCAADNTWSIQTSLNSGKNTLVAQDYNTTDLQGPTTPSVAVNYLEPIIPPIPNPVPTPAPAPVVTVNNSQTSIIINNFDGSNKDTKLPMLLSSDFHYQAFDTGSDFSWSFDLSGGKPPYILNVDWGDGVNSTVNVPTDPTIVLHHKYLNSGYYPIIIMVQDAKGSHKILQLAALVKPTGAAGIINFTKTTTSHNTKLSQESNATSFVNSVRSWLWLAWPTYLIVLLMVVSYWLGEKNEYQLIFKRKHSHPIKR
jgi:hypothetical protein